MLGKWNLGIAMSSGLLLALAAGCAVISAQPPSALSHGETPGPAITAPPRGPTSALPDTGGSALDTPVAQWNGVPIMPGAISGRAVHDGYIFAIRVGPSEIAEFYTVQMTARGYEAVPGNATSDDGLYYALRFRRGEDSLVITIMPQPTAVEVLIEK